MKSILTPVMAGLVIALSSLFVSERGVGGESFVSIETPMAPPTWALLERQLLRANEVACQEFFDRYFDERGFLLCVERWGGDDGPDDAIENLNSWPILHALGADDSILRMTKKAWEGHLRQFTLAKTTDVPFARDGMYYKEFPVMFDWLHNGEGLTVFDVMGLSDPNRNEFERRVRRYAGFYMNEDPQAPNYDPKHKIIRSLFNGSRGPLLRKATGLDWAGDPIEVEHRFGLGHGERTYQEMVDHFKDYNDIVGDHPGNLAATSLALNAYMLTGEAKYKKWLLEYVDAWRERTKANNGIIPSNIGLNGEIGGETDGKWYGGVYGWAFTVIVPQTGALAHRMTVGLGIVGFGNALMMTGDLGYADVWGNMLDVINSNSKTVDGKKMYPQRYGDDGWFLYSPSKFSQGAMEVYYWTMAPKDRKRVSDGGWIGYLEGKNPGFPEQALRGDFENIRRKVAAMRQDETTPDTRLSDDPMKYNPASTVALIHLMLGGIHPQHRGAVLHCRLRYFDPIARRAGLPADVGALVEKLTADSVTVSLVNVNQSEARTVVVQAGGYAEHQFKGLKIGDRDVPLDGTTFTVQLAPGAGAKLQLRTARYANQPTMVFPWDRR